MIDLVQVQKLMLCQAPSDKGNIWLPFTNKHTENLYIYTSHN